MADSRSSWISEPVARAIALSVAAAVVTLGHAAPSAGQGGAPATPGRSPQVVLISVDGARPDVLERLFASGALDRNVGLGRLARHGVVARQNVTATPSVTAVAHTSIATGSTAAHTNVAGNYFHSVAAPIGTGISGYGAPVGGYALAPLGPSPTPTAVPLWVTLRNAGKTVVTATWPNSDGAEIRVAGALVQAPAVRTADYTVPFGAFAGPETRGFALAAADFTDAGAALGGQLAAAGHRSHSPVRVTRDPLEVVFCRPPGGPRGPGPCGTTAEAGRTLRYELRVAALDTTDDGAVNYDTLLVFDGVAGVRPGPFALPSTGPAVLGRGGPSARFLFEGSGLTVGTAFFASAIAPDLSTVRLARYAGKFVPRPPAVLAAVDDVHAHVGFWEPGTDSRALQRGWLRGFERFPEGELEAIYLDQAAAFVAYQTRLARRALAANPAADLVMLYVEQPDGVGHQFTLTDPRQASDPADGRTVGRPGQPAGAVGQEASKVARYASHVRAGYGYANAAVEAILQAIGLGPDGAPVRDVIVVSDHGMTPIHTSVSLPALLRRAGVPSASLGLYPAGPAVNVYVDLAGREAGGAVSVADYRTLVADVARALAAARDDNTFYNPGGAPLFSLVRTRPDGCGRPGFCTDEAFGQDTGDVFAQMREGYTFDGIQVPAPVARLGDTAEQSAVYSVPGYYGTHGYDSELASMSAIFYAAGPSFARGKTLDRVRNIDVAPTVLEVLGVAPAPTVDGAVLRAALRAPRP